MICPHCEHDLLRRERTGNRCSRCSKQYALDPKTNPLRLNDLRVRRITAALTDEGRIGIVPDQLWYALSRKRIKDSTFAQGCLGMAAVVGGVAVVAAVVSEIPHPLIVTGAMLIAALVIGAARSAGAGKGIPPVSREAFPGQVLAEWRKVYGALPPGVLDAKAPKGGRAASGTATGTGGDTTNGVLVCPDPAVVAFLVAAGLPARYGLVPARSPEEARAVPSGGPVLVLHDTDASGELLVRQLRDALLGRTVVDAGPPLRSVRSLPQAVAYRDPGRKPGPEQMRLLAELGTFTPEELKWLGKGWRFPLVGLPPARLLAVVDRVAAQVTRGVDADLRRAADLGFLTWPEAAGPDLVGGR
ncbi:hypothetical protein ABT034_34155 [Streptomyces sp. NPDC002773]|uniref:hypothetical protein n=1 Tax=Streptomyces sp. NPDC002773 TaxID=3154430 RepID=UPI00331B6648